MPKELVTADFHSHTKFSDGKHSPEEMIQAAKEQHLSLYAISDHNTVRGIENLDFQEIREKYNILLYPAFELSLQSGHFVIVNMDLHTVPGVLEKYQIAEGSVAAVLSKKQTQDVLKLFKAQGALIFCAHPLIPPGIMSTKKNELVDLFEKGLIHGAEVNNHELKNKAGILYLLWHKKVNKFLEHEGIPKFSNSDAHKKEDVGTMVNEYNHLLPEEVLSSLIK